MSLLLKRTEETEGGICANKPQVKCLSETCSFYKSSIAAMAANQEFG